MNIDHESLIESLQGIILAQTHTMAMMFKALVRADTIDGRAFIASMRENRGYNLVADDLLKGQAQALERWLDDDMASEPDLPAFTVINGGRED